MSDYSITLRIGADGKPAIASIQQIKAEVRSVGQASEQTGKQGQESSTKWAGSLRQVDRALADVASSTRRTSSEIQRATDFLKGMVGAFVSIQGARALMSLADQASGLNARLRLATSSQQAFNIAQAETFAIAQRTSTALASTVQLYARIQQSTQELDIAQSRLLGITETINQTFIVSGTSAANASNAIIQLTQAFAGGVLRAEEFNSIIENSPRLAQAFADGLGVSTGALRQMVNAGEVDVSRMIEALESQAQVIRAEFESMPVTIGQAWVQVQNAVLAYVGDADQASGVSRQIAEAISMVARNFDLVAPAIIAATAAMVGWLALSSPLGIFVAAVAALSFAFMRLADDSRLVSEAVRETAGALNAATGAMDASSASSIRNIAQLREQAEAQLEVARTALEAAKARALFLAGDSAGDGLYLTMEALQQAKQAQADFDALSNSVDHVNERFARAAMDGVRTFFAEIFSGAAASRDFETTLAQWTRLVSDAEEKIRSHKEGTAEYRQELANLILTKAADAGQTEEQIAALRAQLEQGASIIAQADSLRTARSGAAAAAREQAQAEREAAAAQREVEQAAQAAQSAYMGYLQVLDPLAAMELQHAEALAQIDQWHAQGAISAQRYGELKAMAAQTSAQAVQALNRERDVLGQVTSGYRMEMQALQMTARQAFVYAQAQDAINRAAAAGLPLQSKQIKLIEQMAGELYDAREAFGEVQELLREFGDDAFSSGILDLVDGIRTMQEEIDKLKLSDTFDPAQVEEMERALGRMNDRLTQDTLEGYRALLGAAQTFTKEGSRGFQTLEAGMAALSIIQDVLAMKAAITAVLSQGNAPPPMSFAAMAAMAAAVAPLLASIGLTIANFAGSGGGFVDTAAQRQATQGTGTVLGDADAKSESIANAIQITADATSELVGINRGMLNALIALQSGIGSATGMLARGAGNVDFDTMVIQPLRHAFLGSVFTPMLRFLSGSSQITDRGIMIGGGGVGNLNPQAYQEEQYRTWRFGSRRTREQTAALPGNVAAQFDLIMDSIVSTVREAATALGLVPEEIEAAIAAYEVAVTRISLEDLSAEEQQAELEAVFSSIFDGLAGSVVPFIEQFQQVGEGLGETLVRVATGVQVMQEAVRRLGFSLDETDPERFAQASEALIELSGGLEGFIAGMSSFMDKFATDAFRFEVAQDELNRAFEQAGMTVPATRDEMWALMQSLDATTESGREQIATLLRLADVADEYYRLLERRGSLDEILMRTLRGDWSGPIQELQALNAEYQQAMENAAALGASEAELGMIRGYFTRQALRLAGQLMESALQLAQQLGYLTGITGDAGAAQSEIGSIGEVAAAVEDRYARELQLLQQLDQFVRSLSTSALSPLTPRQQMNAARQEYERLLALAQGGDLDALGQLQGAAQTYLQQAQGFYGGVGPYEQIFQQVQSTLAGIVAAGPQSQQIGPQTPVFGGPVTVEPGEGWAAQNAIERAMLAQQLVDHLAALSIALNTPVLELMETLGIPITQLAADLGIEISNLTGQAVETLAQLAYDLGLPLGELVQSLGLELPALADGLRELTDQLGIDLGDLSAETAGQLALLAGDLRTDLTTLTTALGIDLGRLTDVNSPIFQALEQTLDSLSPAIRDQLQPHLEAVRNATTEADANAAIDLLRDVVGDLPVGIRAQLAPILGTPYPGALTEIDYLEDIDLSLVDLLDDIGGPNGTNSILRDIFQRLGQQGGTSASYAVGTSYVPHDMQAQIHQGEMILPAPVADFVRREGLFSAANDSGELVSQVRALRNELAALRKERSDDAKAQREAQQAAGDALQRTARAAEVANEIRRTG